MPTRFLHHTLPNGLTVVAEADPDASTAAVGFFVKTGARDEPAPLMGVSHFLEHMMFKGTEDMSAEDLNRRYDELGARNNAYTSHEVTCFYASVLPGAIGAAVDLTARMMRPALREADFDTEKGVILEEIAMYEDNPFWVLYERAAEAYYGSNPLGHRVLGTRETIAGLTRDQMSRYFSDRYAADATTVALAGRIDFDDACRRIERHCGGWPRTAPHAPRSAPSHAPASLELADERFDRAYSILLAPGPASESQDRYAATLAMQILGAQDNSRLHWALIESGTAEEAQAGYQPCEGSGECMVFASGDPARIEEIERIVGSAIDELPRSLSPADLDRLRARFATSFTASSERPGDRMQRIGRRWSMLGDYQTLDDELERIQSVTIGDVRAVLGERPLSPRTVATLRPPSAG